MINTDKYICRALVGLLASKGITDVVVCPGTRNAPLVQASHASTLALHHVIDERVASFVALGIAAEQGRPVAVICTSGSAVLDMSPACAEALYRHIPMVVISADRPYQWIDQGDGQTIHQGEALASVVCRSWNIPEPHNAEETRAAIRMCNDALRTVCQEVGPVHINIQIAAPLNGTIEIDTHEDIPEIKVLGEDAEPISERLADRIADDLMKFERILILPGVLPPDEDIDAALAQMARLPQVVVLPEILSNIHAGKPNVDVTLNALTAEERRALLPEVVVTMGGGITSGTAKEWLRDGVRRGAVQHWHIGVERHAVDTFTGQTAAIPMSAHRVLPMLARHCSRKARAGTYSAEWDACSAKAQKVNEEFFVSLPWCELSAIRQIISALPSDYTLHLSNGTTVRYAQTSDYGHLRRVFANRGVNGIDGSTSTAVGASMVSKNPVVLITGDMSAQYDIGALLVEDIPGTFNMIVINNNGGGIFRAISNTRRLPVMPQYLAGGVTLPLEEICRRRGFAYFPVDNSEDLHKAYAVMTSANDTPCVIEVMTDPTTGADVFRHLYTLYKNNTK